jgi:hypothetical protein
LGNIPTSAEDKIFFSSLTFCGVSVHSNTADRRKALPAFDHQPLPGGRQKF